MSGDTKVLVIDQYPEHVDTLVHTLAMYGCLPRGTTDIIEGLADFRSWAPHLVICECGHKDMTAWEFAFEARGIVLPHRPYMVALSDEATRKSKALCEECGFDLYEVKPIYAKDLRKWLNLAEKYVSDQDGLGGESWDN
jgi:CheY-like chemotaxis protein